MTTDLARRLVACPRWPARSGDSFCLVHRGRLTCREHDTGRFWIDVAPGDAEAHDWLPDLDDAATVGCLLALVREAYNRPDLHTCPMFSLRTGDLVRWRVALDEHMAHYGPTEAAALVAALEAT